MSKAVILTGLRANDELHLGNYLGAILPIVELQRLYAGEYQVNMFIPDLHSFTTPVEHGTLYQQSINNLKIFVAAGLNIDDPNTYIYRQSFVPAHSELTWILSCFTYFGELSRMTQFKEKAKAQDQKEAVDENPNKISDTNVSAGLFNYPILMAADILLYGAEYVPVGEDQRQHIELTRDIATRMNNKFGFLFVVPKEWSKQLEFFKTSKGVRIRSLTNPSKKMSKSVDDPSGTIKLSDLPDEAAKKVMGAETDSLGKINFDWETQPGISNLLQILSLLSKRPQDAVNQQWIGKTSYGELKQEVARVVREFLTTIQGHLAGIDDQAILNTLEADEVKMNEVANQRLAMVQKKVGLRA